MKNIRAKIYLLITVILLLGLVPFDKAFAGTFSKTIVRFDRMAINTASTGTVCVAPSGTTAIASVLVTFPSGFATNAAANWTIDTTNNAWPSGATALTGVGTATSVSASTAGTVTFPVSPALTTVGGTLYCFNWNNSAALTEPISTATNETGSVTTKDAVNATIDAGTYSTATITSDQVTVTASVAETFSLAVPNNTDNLGALSTSGVVASPTPRTAVIGTNSSHGWSAWAKDSNTGLHSTVASKTIASTTPGTNSTLSGGTEGYNTGVTSSQVGGTGTITVDTAFVGGSAGRGGGLDTSLRTLATSNGTANQATLTLTNNAAISPITPAASDYQDIITVIAAASF